MPDDSPTDLTITEPSLAELGRALFTEAGVSARLPGHSWLPPAPEELQTQLPQFEILDMIGRGGMGAVYLATQSALDRLVAVKILSADLDALDPGFSERFKNEARVMAKLSHPGIVAIHEFGETASGLHFIIMEFVEGTNVQQMITASRRLRTEHALAITAHVCDALHYAHERGIIHRDIKPANIIVGYDGSVKVADFGLAKVGVPGVETRQLTRSGTTLGTPHYIAPEALVPGAPADRRADIYAAGVMLYHMLTGKLPQGLFELPSIQVPGLDPRLDAIIARAMREDRDLRYPTAADMRADLDGILTQPIPAAGPGAALPDEARPQRPGGKTPQPTVGADPASKKPSPLLWTLAAALLATGGWLYLDRAPEGATEPEGALTALTTGWQDLLPALAATPLQSATWSATADGSLTCDTPRENATTVLHSPPIPACQVRVRFASTDFRNIVVFLPTPAGTITFGINKYRRKVGPFNVTGPTMDSVPLADIVLDDGKDHEFLVEMTPARLTACIDGALAFEKDRPDYSQILSPSGYPPIRGSVLGLGAYYGKVVFKACEARSPPAETEAGASAPKTLEEALLNYHWEWTHAPLPPDKLTFHADGTATCQRFTWKQWQITGARTARASRAVVDGKELADWEANLYFDDSYSTLHAYSVKGSRHYTGRRMARRDNGHSAASKNEQASSPPPDAATKDLPFINSLGMKFVPVPGTRVLMCVHETRRQDYAAFAEGNPKTDPSWRLVAFRGHQVGETDDHPVVYTSWLDARAFCQWLGEKESLTYRLPRDREWSHAVGIADREDPAQEPGTIKNLVDNLWPWGGDFPPKAPLANLADMDLLDAVKDYSIIRGYRDGHAMTAPVMSYPANALGIHDLGGNVWEWCEDTYGSDFPSERILRGGCYLTSNRDWCLSSHRTPRDPVSNRNHGHGFRCVLDLGGEAPPPPEEKAAPAGVQASAVPSPAAPPARPLPAVTKAEPFTNTLGMKFVPVPGTQVLFCIHETRRQDYAAYAETVPGVPANWRVAAKGGHLVSTEDDHPVVNVNQGDALAFCAWLGRKENRRYRLPTDREWSCAAGIGHLEPPHATSRSLHQGLRNLRYWGTEWPPSRNHIGNYSDKSYKALFPQANAIDDGRSYDDGHALIAPVMSYPPNEFGIHDLDGNVWEWCQDFFESPTSANRGLARGSYWAAYNPGQLLVTHRQTGHGRTRCADGGFRIVLEAGQ